MHWRAHPPRHQPAALLARWALGAWFCLLLVSMLTPWARATPPAGWEAVCTASGSTHWVPSPASDDAATPHGLDCALCLLVGAPPADVPATALPTARPLLGNRWARSEAPRVAGVWAPLLARGPPAHAA